MICDCSQNTGDVSGYSKEKVPQSLAVRSCVQLLKWYKRFISPLFPPSCRFTPTCSEYAIDALQKKGVFCGTLLAVYRLLRCHPFARGGYDPVEK